MSMMMEISLFPADHGESFSPYVARCLEIIERSGLPYKLGPMGTTLEAPSAREIFAVVERCLTELQKDCHRVEGNIKFDWRAGEEPRLEEQTAKVEQVVGHRLRT